MDEVWPFVILGLVLASVALDIVFVRRRIYALEDRVASLASEVEVLRRAAEGTSLAAVRSDG